MSDLVGVAPVFLEPGLDATGTADTADADAADAIAEPVTEPAEPHQRAVVSSARRLRGNERLGGAGNE